MNLLRFLSPKVDAPEEHRISMPGLDLSFNHETHTVFVVDQTGTKDTISLQMLEKWYKDRGWFMHCVVVAPPTDDEFKKVIK